jgi:hypothetical protein
MQLKDQQVIQIASGGENTTFLKQKSGSVAFVLVVGRN